MSAAAKTVRIADLKDNEIFTDNNNVGHIGLKTEVDIQQRKWFNEDQKAAKYDGLMRPMMGKQILHNRSCFKIIVFMFCHAKNILPV